MELLAVATDYLSNSLTVALSCDTGELVGDIFTAPSVAVETIATCTATATDSGNRSTSVSLSLVINPLIPVLSIVENDADIKAAKIITLAVEHAQVLNSSIMATIDSEPIELARLNENQLSFILPMLSPGAHVLTLTLEGQLVSLDFNSQDTVVPWIDSSDYVREYLRTLQTDIVKITALGTSSLAPGTLEELSDFLDPDGTFFSNLSKDDKELLAHLIYQNIIPVVQELKLGKLTTNPAALSADPTCLVLGGTALSIAGGTIATIALIPFTGPLSVPAVASIAILNIANYAVIWPSAEKACTREVSTAIENVSAALPRKSKVQVPVFTSAKNMQEGTIDLFSNESKRFTAKREYEIIEGNEESFQNIIDSYNNLGLSVRGLIDYLEATSLPVVGKINVPNALKSFFAESISFEDIKYKETEPDNIDISGISIAEVTGGITKIYEDKSFDMTFLMNDLTVSSVDFQFLLTETGLETPLATVKNATVTLNPPVAYEATFAAIVGEDLVGQLAADFETKFVIKSQPAHGVVDMSPPFDESGIFTYTVDESITEDTTDSFNFVAINGSDINNGESELKTITINITANPYTISVGNYRPSYNEGVTEQRSIVPNQNVTFYNTVTKLVGAKLEGQQVVVANTSWGGDYYFWSYNLPVVEFGPEDVVVGSYNFNLQDMTNGRQISVPVQLTISNEAYRRIVGATLTVHGYGFDNASVHFKDDFTYTINGEHRGSYSLVNEIYDSYVTCAESVIDKEAIGAIRTNGRSGAYGELPNYIIIHKDGTYVANSFYGCPERSTYKEIF